jgi:hypothetical protein
MGSGPGGGAGSGSGGGDVRNAAIPTSGRGERDTTLYLRRMS